MTKRTQGGVSQEKPSPLSDVLAKSCFSIEIKLSHQLYSLAQFIIPRGGNFDTNFLGKVRLKWRKIHIQTFAALWNFMPRERQIKKIGSSNVIEF